MTAEPDALRLVPVKSTGAMQAAGRDALEPFVGALKQPVEDQWHLARLVWDAMLAAAPAVQPAAGRDTFLKAIGQLSETVTYRAHRDMTGGQEDFNEGVRALRDAIVLATAGWDDDLCSRLAALAHPPAQDSESGGEVERVIALMRTKGVEFRGGELCWHFDSVRDGFPLNAQERADLQAALSQPGPASEGDPAHD